MAVAHVYGYLVGTVRGHLVLCMPALAHALIQSVAILYDTVDFRVFLPWPMENQIY